MNQYVLSVVLLALLPSGAYAESAHALVWPQSESFYNSKGFTDSRRVVEPAANAGYAPQTLVQPIQSNMLSVPSYPAPMGYAPRAFPNSPSGFLPSMPQNLPNMPNFSMPSLTVPSMQNAMPSYGGMPFSPMPSFGTMPFNAGGFPGNGFGNMMPFPGGNSFSGMPFGFGY